MSALLLYISSAILIEMLVFLVRVVQPISSLLFTTIPRLRLLLVSFFLTFFGYNGYCQQYQIRNVIRNSYIYFIFLLPLQVGIDWFGRVDNLPRPLKPLKIDKWYLSGWNASKAIKYLALRVENREESPAASLSRKKA